MRACSWAVKEAEERAGQALGPPPECARSGVNPQEERARR